MKSLRWKIVAITDINLRKVRKNFRILLKLALDDEILRLREIEELYRNKRLERGLTPSQWKREAALSKKKNDLLHAFDRSILSCAECTSDSSLSFDKDMVWNPLLKHWVCVECYFTKYPTDYEKKKLRNFLKKRNTIHNFSSF